MDHADVSGALFHRVVFQVGTTLLRNMSLSLRYVGSPVPPLAEEHAGVEKRSSGEGETWRREELEI